MVIQINLGRKSSGLLHRLRQSWPLNQVDSSRDFELLVVALLVVIFLAVGILLLVSPNTSYGL